jgi:hypothetical protein
VSFDVTPVGTASEATPVASIGGGEDPFGSRPKPRRRRPWLVVLGLLLVFGGIGGLVYGIVEAVTEASRIGDDAVGHGTARVEDASPVTFEVPAGGRRHFTVWVDFDGVTANADVQETMVANVVCVAVMPDGVQTAFRGAVQGVSVTLGSKSTIGHFSSLPGRVRVECRSTGSAEALPFLVTPGKPSFVGSGIGWILGGIGTVLLGGFLAIWGFLRRPRR